MKIDAVPGIDTQLRVTPNRIGEYPVVCAELCGLGHAACARRRTSSRPPSSTPGSQERAQQAAAAAERAARSGGAGAEGEGSAENGKAVFAAEGCGGCHTLADAGSTGGTGPDLDEALADKDEAIIEESIVDPNAEITEGFQDGIMPPTYGQSLTPAELDSLVKYLAEVTN